MAWAKLCMLWLKYRFNCYLSATLENIVILKISKCIAKFFDLVYALLSSERLPLKLPPSQWCHGAAHSHIHTHMHKTHKLHILKLIMSSFFFSFIITQYDSQPVLRFKSTFILGSLFKKLSDVFYIFFIWKILFSPLQL